MAIDYVILPDADAEEPCRWLRVSEGRIVRRGKGTDWLPPADDDDEGEATGRVMLVLPAETTALHWIETPGMTARQGAAAARLMALEASIGDAGVLHAAADENDDPDQPHVVAVASHAAMVAWLDWCRRHEIAQASLVPAALLLPPPETGFVAGKIGGHGVLRGTDSALDARESYAPLVLGDAPVAELTPEAVDAVLLAALDDPPLDMRQGDYAPRLPRLFAPDRLKRMGAMLAGILVASLVIALVTLIRLHAEAARLDAQTTAIARTVDPTVADAADADAKIAALLAQRGGAGGFTGTMAGLMTAMQASPAVVMTSVNQLADGTLRLRLSGTSADEINAVLLAIQDAGWRISANSVQQQAGKLVADITVVRT